MPDQRWTWLFLLVYASPLLSALGPLHVGDWVPMPHPVGLPPADGCDKVAPPRR